MGRYWPLLAWALGSPGSRRGGAWQSDRKHRFQSDRKANRPENERMNGCLLIMSSGIHVKAIQETANLHQLSAKLIRQIKPIISQIKQIKLTPTYSTVHLTSQQPLAILTPILL